MAGNGGLNRRRSAQRASKHAVPALTSEVTLRRSLKRKFGLRPVGLRPGGGAQCPTRQQARPRTLGE